MSLADPLGKMQEMKQVCVLLLQRFDKFVLRPKSGRLYGGKGVSLHERDNEWCSLLLIFYTHH